MNKTSVAPEPWERQPGETSAAFEAFKAYRDMGAERSIRACAERVPRSVSMLKRWSARWDWVDRSAAYDNYIDAQEIKKRKRRRAEANTKRAAIADGFLAKVVKRLNNMTDEELNKASLRSLAEVFRIAAEVQDAALAPDAAEIAAAEKEADGARDWGLEIERLFEYDAAREDTMRPDEP